MTLLTAYLLWCTSVISLCTIIVYLTTMEWKRDTTRDENPAAATPAAAERAD